VVADINEYAERANNVRLRDLLQKYRAGLTPSTDANQGLKSGEE
jgi:hypothetical protein